MEPKSTKNSIELPQGGATAASPFVCRNVGGSPPKQWNNEAREDIFVVMLRHYLVNLFSQVEIHLREDLVVESRHPSPRCNQI